MRGMLHQNDHRLVILGGSELYSAAKDRLVRLIEKVSLTLWWYNLAQQTATDGT